MVHDSTVVWPHEKLVAIGSHLPKFEISNRKTFADVLFHSGDDWSFCQLNLSTNVFQFQVGNRKPSVYAGANWEATENCSFCGTSVHSGILTSLSHPAEVDAPWLSVDVHEVVDQPCLKVAWTQCVWNMCVCVSPTQGVCARSIIAYASPCNVPVGLYDCLHGGGLYQQALH